MRNGRYSDGRAHDFCKFAGVARRDRLGLGLLAHEDEARDLAGDAGRAAYEAAGVPSMDSHRESYLAAKWILGVMEGQELRVENDVIDQEEEVKNKLGKALEKFKACAEDIAFLPGLGCGSEILFAELCIENGIAIEITSRAGHNRTNGHVVQVAREAGCRMVVDSDAHAPHDIMGEKDRLLVAKGSGLSDRESRDVLGTDVIEMLSG